MTDTVRSAVPSSRPVGGPDGHDRHDSHGAATGPAGRIPLLDLLRGTAILGTLMTNVWLFTGPGAEWGVLSGSEGASLHGLLTEPSWSSAVESVFRFLADGKFLSMLTMLFSVGLAIQYGSAARRGQPWPGRYKWRALFLFAEGTVHFVLVFAWDVLMGYAVTALVVAWLLSRTERFRHRVMWAAAGFHLAMMVLLTLVVAATEPGGGGEGTDSKVVELYAHGGYLDIVTFRLQNAIVLRMEPVLSFGLLLFLFLLGVRLYRAGAFAPDATGRRIRTRMLAWGLGVGLPLNAAASLGDFFLLSRYVAAPVVAIGLIGLIGTLADRLHGTARRPGVLSRGLTTGLTSVGRMALTCYVAQNVLCVLASYGIGLGLASRLGHTGPWWVIGLWATVCAVLMTGSTLWLRKFTAGPLESLQKRVLQR
ncbi:DUF418 domain-containing protein [Streptomyces sp. UNOC14_S4]|uniref:DUF418 domain-containing protein n=1 Tax=Streptomyces sp. UNOC14_S4 TaxID=2872340 RepID=UPI001E3C4AE3|nr:DUF418 domain-containing protein [Streptomyces sp. UNOC14_S4]MCC3770652.1 DUF418 domain-containing protein [Streptomyces sp. UNOC14_S4]